MWRRLHSYAQSRYDFNALELVGFEVWNITMVRARFKETKPHLSRKILAATEQQ
jgi:hypothetical protein